MEVFGIVMTIASMMMAAYAQQVAAKNAAKAAEFQQNQENAKAADAHRLGEIEAEKAAIKGNKFLSSTRLLFGKGNVEGERGSPMSLTSESAAWGRYDLDVASSNAARNKWGHEQSAAAWGFRKESGQGAANLASVATLAGGAYDISTQVGFDKKENKWYLGSGVGKG